MSFDTSVLPHSGLPVVTALGSSVPNKVTSLGCWFGPPCCTSPSGEKKKNHIYSGTSFQNLVLCIFKNKSTVWRFVFFVYESFMKVFQWSKVLHPEWEEQTLNFQYTSTPKSIHFPQEFCLFYRATNKIDIYLPSSFHAHQLLNIWGALNNLYLTSFESSPKKPTLCFSFYYLIKTVFGWFVVLHRERPSLPLCAAAAINMVFAYW